jgi:hypothetical protein
MTRDSMIESCAREANGIKNVGIVQSYVPEPGLITFPAVLVFGNSSSQIDVALMNNRIFLCHDNSLPTEMD